MGAFAWPLAALGTSCGCVSILLAAPIATSGLQTVRPRSCFVRGGERHGPAGRRTHVQVWLHPASRARFAFLTGTERNMLLLHDVLICEWNGFLQAVTCLLIRVDFYIIIKMCI